MSVADIIGLHEWFTYTRMTNTLHSACERTVHVRRQTINWTNPDFLWIGPSAIKYIILLLQHICYFARICSVYKYDDVELDQ